MAFEIGKNALQLGMFFGILILLGIGQVTGNQTADQFAGGLGIIGLFLKQIQLGGEQQ
jgi:hypothetical protein